MGHNAQMKEATTLADQLPVEMARNRKLSQIYADLGPVGAFGKAGIDADLDAAERACAEQNLAGMLTAYAQLKDNK